MRRTIASVVMLGLCACSFGFTGGGLPSSIRTAAIRNCDNLTADPAIGQQVYDAIRKAVESRLGLRTATEAVADAIIDCKVVRYEPDQPLAVQSTAGAPGAPRQVNVTQRRVDLVADITVVDRKTGRTVWDGKNQNARGEYAQGREPDGRQKALEFLVKALIDGVNSNW
jgi:hypothetical protein